MANETCPFGELFAESTRNGLNRPKAVRGSGVKMVNMGELFAHSRLYNTPMERVPLSQSEADRFLLHDGDLLFARQSLVLEGAGKCSIFLGDDEPVTFESHVTRVRLDPAKAHPSYYFYYLQSHHGRSAIRSIVEQGAGASGIRGSDLATLKVEWRSLPEQRAIAHVLGTLDDKIELNRRMNETLEEMARALFKSWFVDFDPVRAKAALKKHALHSSEWKAVSESSAQDSEWTVERARAYLDVTDPQIVDFFPDRLVQSELAEVPEGWEVGALDDTIELLSGGTPRTSIASYWGGNVPWYTAKDAPSHSDVFVLDTERTITEAGVANSAARLLPAETTTITARGTVGRLACLGKPMAINQTCYGIRGANGYPNLFTYWHVRAAVDDLKQRIHGTIFDTITRQTFKLVERILPPLECANAFESTIRPFMRHILNNIHESQALAAQRDALLPDLLSRAAKVTGIP